MISIRKSITFSLENKNNDSKEYLSITKPYHNKPNLAITNLT